MEIRHPDLTSACFGRAPLPAQTTASQGPAQDCIVDKIAQFQRELTDLATPTDERRMALQFLLHFVGDLHQPLHSSDDNGRGGNNKTVTAPGRPRGKLHAFGIRSSFRHSAAIPIPWLQSSSRQLRRRIRLAGQKAPPTIGPSNSFEVARTTVYGKLPAPNPDGSYDLSPAYVAAAKDAVSGQVSGLRRC